MTDTPKTSPTPGSLPLKDSVPLVDADNNRVTEAQRRAEQREARVAAKLRENLRRRKAAARKQKQD